MKRCCFMSSNIELVKKKLAENPNNKKLIEELAFTFSDEIEKASKVNNLDKIEEIISNYYEFIEKYPKSEALQKSYGYSILNVLPTFFTRFKPIKIKQIINTLREFSEKLDSLILKEILAMILVNTIYDFSLINQINSIHEFTLELNDLSRKYPKNEKIQTAVAKGLMNSTMFFIQKNDQEAAQTYYENLLKIINTNPNTEMVDSRQLIQLKEHFKEKQKI